MVKIKRVNWKYVAEEKSAPYPNLGEVHPKYIVVEPQFEKPHIEGLFHMAIRRGMHVAGPGPLGRSPQDDYPRDSKHDLSELRLWCGSLEPSIHQ